MIIGIGTDITDIRRLEQLEKEYGGRFLNRVFTPAELKRASEKSSPIQNLGRRFAAKEAFFKALGTGFLKGVSWQDVEIANHPSGQPHVTVSGKAREILGQRSPTGVKIDLSLSDEYPYAVAFVVLSAA